jgi:signal transduction histidine kinase
VEIAALASQAETYGRSVCANHAFSVDVDAELTDRSVRADSDRMAQVIRNLVSNAAKYSRAGSAITVHMRRSGPATARIEVADEGRGISAGDLERIFDKFGRADSATGTRVPGVGLGLYICRRLVLSHGSDLTVRSDVGRGSVFGFDLALVGPDQEVP